MIAQTNRLRERFRWQAHTDYNCNCRFPEEYLRRKDNAKHRYSNDDNMQKADNLKE
jgi:hypothetical protein